MEGGFPPSIYFLIFNDAKKEQVASKPPVVQIAYIVDDGVFSDMLNNPWNPPPDCIVMGCIQCMFVPELQHIACHFMTQHMK